MRTRTKIAERKKVIEIGAGFAGIRLVRRLDKGLFDILLTDKLNHYQFKPLFYQVATSQIELASIDFRLRNIFRSKRTVRIRMAEVISIIRNKLIIFINGSWKYMTEDTSLRLILTQTENRNRHFKQTEYEKTDKKQCILGG